MKNKFILGLILASVLLMSVIGVSAQITGNAVITGDIAEGGQCDGGGTYHYNIEAQSWLCVTGIDIKKDDSLRAGTSPTGTKTSSIGTKTSSTSAKARTGSECPPGKAWTTTTAVDGNPCCRKVENTGRSLFRGRFLGKLFE